MNGFHWGMPGLDRDYFVAIMNLVAIRCGRDARLLDGMVAEDMLDYEPSKLRIAFLDRLAEVISRRKIQASYVAATAMRESGDCVVLYVAINDNFKPSDKDFFASLQKLLVCLNVEGPTVHLSNELRNLLLGRYKQRISSYASSLHRSLREFCQSQGPVITFKTGGGDGAHKILGALIALKQLTVNDCCSEDLSDATALAYELRMYEAEIREVLDSLLSAPHSHDSVWKKLCWMGQFEAIYKTMLEAATKLVCFRYVTITPVSIGKDGEWNVFRSKLTLSDTFRRLGKPVGPETVSQYVMGTKLSSHKELKKVEDQFQTQLHEKTRIHAEIQIAIHFLQEGLMESTPIYIGCSRRSCYMCHEFLRLLGMFTTRGCHYWLYPRWSIPCIPRLSTTTAGQVARTILQIQNSLETEMSFPVPTFNNPRSECELSSIGRTLCSASLDHISFGSYVEVEKSYPQQSPLDHPSPCDSDSPARLGYLIRKGLGIWKQVFKNGRESVDNQVYS